MYSGVSVGRVPEMVTLYALLLRADTLPVSVTLLPSLVTVTNTPSFIPNAAPSPVT